MPTVGRKVSRVVGLSTEMEPTSLGRTECPAMQNVEVDRGGVCRTRDGTKRLHATPYKDASWRLRGAPYNATVFHEYYDAIIIPSDTRYDVATGTNQLVISGTLRFSRSPVDTYLSSNGDTYIVGKGDVSALQASLPIRIFIDYSAGFRWNAVVYDSVSAALYTSTVADTALDTSSDGVGRYFELRVGFFDSGTAMRLTLDVYDTDEDTQVGTAETNIGSTWGITANTNPIVVGSYVDSGGYPAIAATHNYLSAKIAELRWEVGALTISRQTLGTAAWKRELRPSEYSASTVKGYWKFNDGDYTRVRDFCDTVENTLYTGSLKGNHGQHWNVAPQWIRKTNSIPYGNGTTNAYVTNGATGITCINRFALLFNGLQGIAMGRSGWVQSSVQTDPLVNVYAQTPAANVGWCVEVVVTLLMQRGESTYPNRTIYDSGIASAVALNPIKIDTTGDAFRIQFKDTAGTRTATLGTVSEWAGEMITIAATKSNTTITFYVIGSVSGRVISTTTAASPNIGSVATGPDDGPFVLIGRTPATTKSITSDDPVTYDARAMFGVFHEFRLYSAPRSQSEIVATANKDVPVSARSKLVVYLKADAGQGDELSNYGTSVSVTIPTITVGTQVYSQNSFLDTRILPSQESGPVPDEGLVIPFESARARGAIDFRNIIGESVARQTAFIAGCSLYTFDFSTNTLTHRAGGIFKKDQLATMVVFDGTVYIADGTRVKAWDGSEMRFAGIEAPIERPIIEGGATATTGGTLNDGSYLIGYRFVNTKTGFKSNISPLRQFTLSGGSTSSLVSIAGLEIPQDPQVNAIEVFCTLEGDASRLYRVALVTDLTTGSHTFSPLITTLTTSSAWVDVLTSLEVPNATASPPTFGDLYKFGAPPATKCVTVIGGRMLFAAQNEPGRMYFSRIDGGVQVEHVDLTPGAASAVDIKTDAGDEIQALAVLNDSAFAYMRDSRSELSFTGLDTAVTGGFDLPFQLATRDNDVGAVSPWAVVAVTGSHAVLAETDIYVRSRDDYRIISSPPEDITNPSRPKIGKTIRALDGDYLYRAVAMHRQARQQIWFAVTEQGWTRNNAILIYSYRDRKWMRYTMPHIDFMLEVETDGDRRTPIGFINGFVCQIDDTALDIDGYLTGVMTAGVTTSVSTSGAGYITVPGLPTLTANAHRGTTMWVGSNGSYTQYVISDNTADTIYLEKSGTTITVGLTVYLGSIFPFLDLMMNPGTESDWKRFSTTEVASAHEGMTDAEIVMWIDNKDREPAVSDALYKGRAFAFSAVTKQFLIFDTMGAGRFARMRFQAPKPGKDLNIAEVCLNYVPLPLNRFHG